MRNVSLERLQELGREFIPNGPDEWMCVKFNEDGLSVAVQGDSQWEEDLRSL
jgi:hypothetical protein